MSVTDTLLGLPRSAKILLFLAADTVLAMASMILAINLRYGELLPEAQFAQAWVLMSFMAIAGPIVIWLMGLPRIKLHALESDAIMRVAVTAIALSLATIAVSYMFRLEGSRSIPLIFGAFFFLLATSMRVFGLRLLLFLAGRKTESLPVIVYGAGAAGIQLVSALQRTFETRPVLFVDDNPNLHGVMVSGLQVYPASQLEQLIDKHRIARVLLAIPSMTDARRAEMLTKLTDLPVDVQVLPSYVDLMAGKDLETTLRSVDPDELLGRDSVDLDGPAIRATYSGRTVMITGAGGSIGSELCRQILNCKPRQLILFDQSEYALYAINQELQQQSDVTIIPRLGSVTDMPTVARVLATHDVDIVLHAAAYKHVPLVEDNALAGARNNVIGTHTVATAAAAAGIERFILVSTDKAVRPTNIMGGTKRLAELVVQDVQAANPDTKFAMVRFGNVLGSSGSVLPLFQSQIEKGGPVTVTHPEVTRFFMTIPEAARLVLLAGAYADGSDAFVLDMGKPQKILDIAERMIKLSGRTIKNPETGEGDIEIKIVGLRPGEKLFEELLIDDTLAATPHPKIMRAEERAKGKDLVKMMLHQLQAAIDRGDSETIRRIIADWVEGYQPSHQSNADFIQPEQPKKALIS